MIAFRLLMAPFVFVFIGALLLIGATAGLFSWILTGDSYRVTATYNEMR